MTSTLLIGQEKNIGLLTLNRPNALNALTLEMIRSLYEALIKWQDDASVTHVLIHSSSNRAFCAGGDVRAVYQAKKEGDRDFCDAIFREEYRLNYLLHQYNKPVTCVIDGINMGGGLGLSAHAKDTLITENGILAMPEATIGFFTDIGSSYFLNRCPGHIGTFLALTGYRCRYDDALYAHLATLYVPSVDLSFFSTEQYFNQNNQNNAFTEKSPIKSPMAPHSFLEIHHELIEKIFSAPTIEEILERLARQKMPICASWAKTLRESCPVSLKVILSLLRQSVNQPIEKTLPMEFRLSQRLVERDDFSEGVRALLVDKDKNPRWSPGSLEEISDALVESFFAPLTDREELMLPVREEKSI